MISVCNIGGNIKMTVGSIAGGTLFLKLLNLPGNEYCSKLEKEFSFHVIYTRNISYFLEFPSDI